MSSCSQSVFGRVLTGNSYWHGRHGLGNVLFSLLEIKSWLLPSATSCLENEFDLIQVNLLKTNLGFRLKRGDADGLGLALCTQKMVKGQAVASVTQLDSACVCAWACTDWGCLCATGACPGGAPKTRLCRPKFQWCLEGVVFASVLV